MKKFYFCLLAILLCSISLNAAPYGLLINGTTKLEATAVGEKDFNDREQFLVSCVALNQGDKVQLHDFGSGASWMCSIDPYGEYQKFTKNSDHLVCNAAGSYDFYIKLKYNDDMLYIGPGQNCSNVTPPTPDPNATYYVTGTAELVGADKAWSETAIAMTKKDDNSFTHTFSDLAAGVVYKMKITNGTWANNWGFSAVHNAPAGVVGDTDGNVVFEMESKGNVIVHFNGAQITLEGNFSQTEPIKPIPATSVPSACPDVMLQGFYWDSNQDGKGHGNTKWTTLQAQATEIAAYFDLIWLPPSAKSSGGVGYHPKQYNNQNSDWGSRSDLQKLIATLHEGGAKVIADIVINHIDGKSGWCDYYEQDFGEYGKFQVDGSYICQDDEVNWDADAACKGSATGAADDGYGSEAKYGAARDLAHNEEHVRQMCRAYTKWMIDVMDYDGFRYDYCKGFHNSHIGDYNANAGAYFSVMEYWDGNANTLWNRIQDAGENTLTFDFGVKYQALNDGIAKGNYNGCKAPGLLGMGKGKWAVTFVDSHDSYQRDGNEFGGAGQSMKMKDKLLQANAFILSMPGVPCVFYPHWKEFKSEIGAMVLARKAVGVHSESQVSDEGDYSGYRAWVTGTNGTLIIELGNKVSSAQSGYTKAASGNGYAMWIKTNSAVKPTLIVTPGSTTYKTETLKIEMHTIGASGTPSIYYTLDGSDPKTSTSKKAYTGSMTISGSVTLKAYAVVGELESDVVTCTYTYQAPQTTPLTVKFMPPASWSKVYLYAWDSNGTSVLGSWPGTEWKNKDTEGWLYHVFDAKYKEINIIFSNGSGDQSSDILLDQDACYEWQGGEVLSQNCSLSDIPFQLLVSPESKVFKTESLEITMSTTGAEGTPAIYYTLDNTDPKTSTTKQQYTVPVVITTTTTLKAYAKDGAKETDVQTHTYTYEEPQATPLTISFAKPKEWSKVYLYSWNDGGATLYTGDWPGSEITTTNKKGWYYHIFDAAVKEVNFIFNNGSGTQTADLWTDADVCYGWEVDKAVLIDCEGTDVEDIVIEQPTLDTTRPMYNILGQKVGTNYHGIVIQNGHKYLR